MKATKREIRYCYKTKNKHGILEEYSRRYETKEEAVSWYEKHGIWLERNMGRTLVFIEEII